MRIKLWSSCHRSHGRNVNSIPHSLLPEDMGGRLELDEVVTGLMKLRGPVSKTAPRKNVNCCASTFHCVTSHVISGIMYRRQLKLCERFRPASCSKAKDLIAIRLQVRLLIQKALEDE